MTAALAPGLKHQILLTVEKHHTADAYGNPGVEVFATPALITLFENVCGECIRPFLSEDGFSVGTRVDIRHLGATPLGFEVSAQCDESWSGKDFNPVITIRIRSVMFFNG